MKVKVGNSITDSKFEPVLLIFENDEQRKELINLLVNMPDKEGVRKFVQGPASLGEDTLKQFMKTE